MANGTDALVDLASLLGVGTNGTFTCILGHLGWLDMDWSVAWGSNTASSLVSDATGSISTTKANKISVLSPDGSLVRCRYVYSPHLSNSSSWLRRYGRSRLSWATAVVLPLRTRQGLSPQPKPLKYPFFHQMDPL